MEEIKEMAYAKINIFLDVLKKTEDGYHDLLTIMQLISLHDEVHLELNKENRINISCENIEIGTTPEKNLAYIAAEKFYEKYNTPNTQKVNIRIIKNIPVASGLGGGSADAAAVLRGLNKLYDKPFTEKELCEIGIQIGSDVPFCIVGGTQICYGRGIPHLDIYGIQHYYVVTACADKKLSTKDAYRRLDEEYNNFALHTSAVDYDCVLSHLMSRRCRLAFPYLYNVFDMIYDENSGVQKIKRLMMENDGAFAMVSGSGPTVFGLFDDMIYAEDMQEILRQEGIESQISHPINLLYSEMKEGECHWKY